MFRTTTSSTRSPLSPSFLPLHLLLLLHRYAVRPTALMTALILHVLVAELQVLEDTKNISQKNTFHFATNALAVQVRRGVQMSPLKRC